MVVYMMLFDGSEGAEEEEEVVEDEEPVEDLLKPGHLTGFLDEELAAEVEALCVEDVSGGLERLLSHLRTHRDTCQPPQLQVPTEAAHVRTTCAQPAQRPTFGPTHRHPSGVTVQSGRG